MNRTEYIVLTLMIGLASTIIALTTSEWSGSTPVVSKVGYMAIFVVEPIAGLLLAILRCNDIGCSKWVSLISILFPLRLYFCFVEGRPSAAPIRVTASPGS